MAKGVSGEKHRKKFRRWRNLLGPQARLLSEQIEEILLQAIEAAGFHCVDICLGQFDDPVSANEFQLERAQDDIVDYILVAFYKREPKFQILFGRRYSAPPNEWVRSAKLVARSKQYYFIWGKPWWMPKFFWTKEKSKSLVEFLSSQIGQIIQFLETGERGPNISRAVILKDGSEI